MKNLETGGNGFAGEASWVELAARIKSEEIDIKTVQSETLQMLNYWRKNDPDFDMKVEMRIASRVKSPGKILEKSKKKVKQPKRKLWGQQDFFGQISPPPSGQEYAHEDIISPERRTENIHKISNSRFPPSVGDVRRMEVSQSLKELKKLINIPSIRGKDNNERLLIKSLEKKLIEKDSMGVFRDYDRLPNRGEIPMDLRERIQFINSQINEIVNSDLSLREKYQRFYQLENKYEEKK